MATGQFSRRPQRPMSHFAPPPASRTVVITGTDTGVGKTWLTALLVTYLRHRGTAALALKPFASGGRDDARLLNAAQGNCLELDLLNPFHFRRPLAPLVAMRLERRRITLRQAAIAVLRVQHRAPLCLVEGCGGLRAPLGPGYTLVELARELGASMLVVAANRLGVLNHTLLTVEVIRRADLPCRGVVLVNGFSKDPSCATNAGVLRDWLNPIPVVSMPDLGSKPLEAATLGARAHRCRRSLAAVAGLLGSPAPAKPKPAQAGNHP